MHLNEILHRSYCLDFAHFCFVTFQHDRWITRRHRRYFRFRFPSGGVTGNLSMISPASTMALQSVHTRSPVYPFSSCVGSLKPCRWRFKWHVGFISPYSFPHFSQTAFSYRSPVHRNGHVVPFPLRFER